MNHDHDAPPSDDDLLTLLDYLVLEDISPRAMFLRGRLLDTTFKVKPHCVDWLDLKEQLITIARAEGEGRCEHCVQVDMAELLTAGAATFLEYEVWIDSLFADPLPETPSTSEDEVWN